MAKQINVGVGGVVKKVSKVPISIGGVVKQVKKGVCGVGGVVKEFFGSETVLWDGSSLQNGATWEVANKHFRFDFTQGSLSGKKLLVRTSSDWSNAYVKISTYTTSNFNRYFKSDGTLTTSYATAYSTWSAGTDYLLDLANFSQLSSATYFNLAFGVNGTDRTLSGYVAYIAIV